MIEHPDEEALASHLSDAERQVRGAYFTPRALVERVLDAVTPFVPASGRLRVIDPACGAGAFLTLAAQRWPRAELVGVELNADSAAICRERVPTARVVVGDGLSDAVLPPTDGAFELFVGNPPYNGTSPLLRDKSAWAAACALLPSELTLPRGTSLREDYVFFLLKASRRLEGRSGALAFITSATLLDAFAYAPVRQALLSRMRLREVIELPAGSFEGTRVVPCVTVWSVPSGAHCFRPTAPEWRLRPAAEDAEALHADWSARGAALSALVPVSFAGLKTRFDELLVDDDRAALEARVEAFLGAKDLPTFAATFGLEAFLPKLVALQTYATGARFQSANVRRFLRYRGPKPRGADAWCYVDRKLIPRGDHRLRGDFDPHAGALKLVFNRHELPLAAHLIDEPGCVTMYRHSRFAPAQVPRALLDNPQATRFDAGDLVDNLTPRGAAFGSPRELFAHIAQHLNSRDFQERWAPAFGTSREPVIPLDVAPIGSTNTRHRSSS